MYPGKFYFEDGSFKLIDNDTFKTLKQYIIFIGIIIAWSIVEAKVIPIDANPKNNANKLKIGVAIVEIISITFLNINFSCDIVIDENTLPGKEIAVLNDIIIINILSLAISGNVSPLEKNLSVKNTKIIPPIHTKIPKIL